MAAIIGTYVWLIFYIFGWIITIPLFFLLLISIPFIHIWIGYTGTDYFDCWLIEMDYCWEEGGVYYIPESPIEPSEGYRYGLEKD